MSTGGYGLLDNRCPHQGGPHQITRDFGISTHLWTGLRWLVVLLARLRDDELAATLLGAVAKAPGAPPVYGDDAERLAEVVATLRDRALAFVA